MSPLSGSGGVTGPGPGSGSVGGMGGGANMQYYRLVQVPGQPMFYHTQPAATVSDYQHSLIEFVATPMDGTSEVRPPL